ncbi:MAG: nucleotidyltransferase [Ignavibacteria bacterium]|nr:nucleotidyltransferase [Ignavibacteria bacterium]
MTEELESLKRIVKKLEEGGFEYMLTGSMAMSFYSIPRMTRDSDIVIALNDKDTEKFVKFLSEDFFINEFMVKESLEKNIRFNVFDKKTLFKIDFIIKLNAEYENLKFERRNRLKIEGFEINVISIEDLIISKLMWSKESHSETQLNNIKSLLSKVVMKDYILKKVSELSLKDIFSKIP